MTEKQLLVITVILVVLVVLGGGAGIYFLCGKNAGLIQEINELDQKLQEVKNKEEMNKRMKAEIEKPEFKEREKALSRELPLESPIGHTMLWEFLNQIRRRTHPQIVLSRIEASKERAGAPGVSAPPPGVRRMAYDIELRGTFYDILEYMSEIENAERIIRIENFEFVGGKKAKSSDAETGGATIMDINLRLVAFEFEKPASAPPATTAGRTP
jgi:Tfp pilus assembly protein PilO